MNKSRAVDPKTVAPARLGRERNESWRNPVAGGGPQVREFVRLLDATTPFIAPEELEEKRGARFRARLGANENALGCSPMAAKAALEAATRTNHYPDPRSKDLRRLLSTELSVAEDRILIGSGIDDLLGLTAQGCLGLSEVAVASLGAYPTFQYFVRAVGGVVQGVAYRDMRNDLDGLLAAAWRTSAKMVYLANPDNPTGTLLGAHDIAAFADLLPSTTWLLLDEAYADFCAPGSLAPIGWDRPNLIRYRTFSKAHGLAGCRIGYLIASEALVRSLNKIRVQFGVNAIAQAAAKASIADAGFVSAVVKETEVGRNQYYRLGREVGVDTIPSDTNFVAFDLRDADASRRVADELDKRGVFVRRPQVAPLDRLVRVTVGRADERDWFVAAMRSILDGTGAY